MARTQSFTLPNRNRTQPTEATPLLPTVAGPVPINVLVQTTLPRASEAQSYKKSPWFKVMIALFCSLLFFPSQTLTDSFDLRSLFDYILGRPLNYLVFLIFSIVLGGISDALLGITAYNIATDEVTGKNLPANHPSTIAEETRLIIHPSANHEATADAHHHGKMATILEFAVILTPFTLLGFGACSQTLLDFAPNISLSALLPPSIIIGLATGTGNWMIHRFFAHATAHEQGKHIGFLAGLKKTYWTNLFQNPDTTRKPNKEIVRNIWLKLGILSEHFLEGFFATLVFLYAIDQIHQRAANPLPTAVTAYLATQLLRQFTALPATSKKRLLSKLVTTALIHSATEEESLFPKALVYSLGATIGVIVMLTEGNSEARSVDEVERHSTASPLANRPKLKRTVDVIKFIGAMNHSIPGVLAIPYAIGAVNAQTISDGLRNGGILLGSSLLFLYPSYTGFYSMISRRVDQVVNDMINSLCDQPRNLNRNSLTLPRYANNPFMLHGSNDTSPLPATRFPGGCHQQIEFKL